MLAEKICKVYPEFDADHFIQDTDSKTVGQSYTQRVATLAELLRKYLPTDYKKALPVLVEILGEENPHETGMFTNYYWILPIGKFVK